MAGVHGEKNFHLDHAHAPHGRAAGGGGAAAAAAPPPHR